MTKRDLAKKIADVIKASGVACEGAVFASPKPLVSDGDIEKWLCGPVRGAIFGGREVKS